MKNKVDQTTWSESSCERETNLLSFRLISNRVIWVWSSSTQSPGLSTVSPAELPSFCCSTAQTHANHNAVQLHRNVGKSNLFLQPPCRPSNNPLVSYSKSIQPKPIAPLCPNFTLLFLLEKGSIYLITPSLSHTHQQTNNPKIPTMNKQNKLPVRPASLKSYQGTSIEREATVTRRAR